MKNPPVLISILGFFAVLAGFSFFFVGLRMLGFDWFGMLGNLPAFDHVGLWGWLAIATGLVWVLAGLGLWSLQPWARLFAQIMAAIALFEAVLAFFQFPGQGVGFAMAIMPVFILWYLGSSEVKEAFEEGDRPASTPVAAPAAFVAPAAPVAPTMAAPAPAVVAAAVVATPMDAGDTSASEPADTADAGHQMRIEDVEGIGPAYADKLAAVGIATTGDLLRAGAKPYDRERIAAATGISSKLILEWVDKADLMRVPGVGPQYSDLLEVAGVGSPAELAQRNPANLAVTVQEVVAARPGTVRRVPSDAEIAAWIEAAGNLEQIVEH